TAAEPAATAPTRAPAPGGVAGPARQDSTAAHA
ncbi:MAG: hypothetical protein AVDCRST_MAG41-1584, partial [uncultured Corynebacteriales bacterium]